RPLKDIRDEYNYPKKKGIKDECSRLLEASTMKSRRGFAIQRLMNAMRQAHADGWFIVFDTLTLADDRLEAFRSEERFSRNAETDLVCRLLLEQKNPEQDEAVVLHRLALRIVVVLPNCRTVSSVLRSRSVVFFSNATPTTQIYTLSLHDALPI